MLEGFDETVLGNICGEVRVAGEGDGIPIERILILKYQLIEGIQVALLRSEDKGLFGKIRYHVSLTSVGHTLKFFSRDNGSRL